MLDDGGDGATHVRGRHSWSGGQGALPEPPPDAAGAQSRRQSCLSSYSGAPISNQQPPPSRLSRQSSFRAGQIVKLAKGEVNYILVGPPAPAPLVVCVHGLNGSVASFDKLVPCLLAHGLRVLLYDLYGFGLSANPKGRLDLELLCAQLAALLDAVIGKVHAPVFLLGYSMGGVIATSFAMRYQHRIARLLLVSPAGLLQKSETSCQTLIFCGLRRMWGGCLLSCIGCLAYICAPCGRRWLRKHPEMLFEPDVREPEKFKEITSLNTERFVLNFGRSVTSYLGALRNLPLWEDDFADTYAALARSQTPVLFLWGEHDMTVPWEEVRDVLIKDFASYGNSCILINGAGHGLCLEDPSHVAECAAAWIHNSSDPSWLACLETYKLSGSLHQTGRLSQPPHPQVMGATTFDAGPRAASTENDHSRARPPTETVQSAAPQPRRPPLETEQTRAFGTGDQPQDDAHWKTHSAPQPPRPPLETA